MLQQEPRVRRKYPTKTGEVHPPVCVGGGAHPVDQNYQRPNQSRTFYSLFIRRSAGPVIFLPPPLSHPPSAGLNRLAPPDPVPVQWSAPQEVNKKVAERWSRMNDDDKTVR